MNNIYALLQKYEFTIINDVNDDYKCGICKNILINAHQAICGCNFCFECINQYMGNNATNCPNNTDDCSSESLSNIFPNPIFNKKISKLIVRCPNKMCSYESQLIEMEKHLNTCANISVKCPFNYAGCQHNDMINVELNDHMLSDIHNHSKILIDLIGNLRNEMGELKIKIEESQLQIEILKEKDCRKDEIIESLKEKIQLIKQENEDLTEQMEIGYRNLWYKFDKIDIEMKDKCKNDSIKSLNDEIKLIRQEKEELEEKMKIFEKNIEEKYNAKMITKLCEMRREFDGKLENNIKIKEKNKNDSIKSISDEIKLIRTEKKQLEKEMKLIQINIDEKYDVKIRVMRKELNEKLEKATIEMKGEKEGYRDITNQINQIDKYLNMRDNGILWGWYIGKIIEINGPLRSSWIYAYKYPYYMQFYLENINKELNISLRFYPSESHPNPKECCKANVELYLIALNDNDKNLTFNQLFTSDSSVEKIKISHSDLKASNLLNINCKITCLVICN